ERRSRPSLAQEELKAQERREHAQAIYNDLWRTVPVIQAKREADTAAGGPPSHLGLPEENLLYFIEKFSPRLENWQREILRIVRNIAQYFYPQ
ncbi:SpoVR family protein, partial [Klebsiella pneumoniae]|uniref:SpoVR family protein n=1 Tax=Klebsiella pneumoniae TaxID=573 RepID=UPI003EE3EE9B